MQLHQRGQREVRQKDHKIKQKRLEERRKERRGDKIRTRQSGKRKNTPTQCLEVVLLMRCSGLQRARSQFIKAGR